MAETERGTRFRRLPRQVREQQMLDAAVEVFSRRGYRQASMDEIAEMAGISKPMIYAYLGPKDELFAACITREAHLLVDRISAVVGAGGPPDGPALAGAARLLRVRGRAPRRLARAVPAGPRRGRAVRQPGGGQPGQHRRRGGRPARPGHG